MKQEILFDNKIIIILSMINLDFNEKYTSKNSIECLKLTLIEI